MAYIDQDKKKVIASAMKTVLKGYPTLKYSLAVHNHSELCVTIKSGPACLDANKKGHVQVNHYHIDKHYVGEAATILKLIKGCSDLVNHDNSDIMSDYFDVGHYLSITIGKWNKDFVPV